MTTAIDRLVAALESHGSTIRRTGIRVSAQCPSHDDRKPSLSLTNIEGSVLVWCHANCATIDVLAALSLTFADLYDDPMPRRVAGIRAHAIYAYDNGRRVIRSADKEFRQTNATVPAQLFRLARVRHAVADGVTIYITEGEKDVLALEAAGARATCAPMGAGKWSKIDPSPLYGTKVVIVEDQDDVGRKHAAEVFRSLAGHADVAVVAPKVGKDAAEHIAAGCSLDDFVPVKIDAGSQVGGVIVTLSDVVAEQVDWLWKDRLPIGKIVVLDGDPSVGKSTIAVDCAAHVSTGNSWPDGAHCRTGSVLLLSAEDGLADTIRPRLDAAGGNARAVHALTELRYRDDKGATRVRPVTLGDLDEIESAVKWHCAVLVVIDVLMAFMPGNVDAHRDQDVRSVLSGLASMAERTRCCVILLRHLNKSGAGSAMYRGGGSIGIIGAARVGLLAAADPDDESRRVLAGVKSNLAVMPAALAYQLVDSPQHGCARVEWLGTSTHTAAELLAVPHDEDDRSERHEASEWLLNHLVENGYEASSRSIKKAAHAEGISERTLKRAKDLAKVVHHSTRTTPRTTYWTHPDFESGQLNPQAETLA